MLPGVHSLAKEAGKKEEGATTWNSQDGSTETRAIILNPCFGAQKRIQPLTRRTAHSSAEVAKSLSIGRQLSPHCEVCV